MSGIFAHAWLLVACLYTVRSAAGPTDVSRNQSINECESHNQCPADRACQAFKCMDPCVDHCGDNSECVVLKHIPFCGCKSGYTGTGVNCTKLPECETHEQCPADRACKAFQCVDPCSGRCGNNSECLVHQHIVYCASCKFGYVGNGLPECFMKDPLKKSYFIESTLKKNFNESLEYCKNKGMRLATFDDEEEFKQLVKTIETTGIGGWQMFWVAGSDLAERDVWRWHTTGREMAYLPWYTGQPNHLRVGDEEQHCVAVYRYISDGSAYINDGHCSFPLRPICEY